MKLQTTAMLAATVLALGAVAGCSSEGKKSKENASGAAFTDVNTIPGQSSQTVTVRPGEPGGVVVQTYEQTAKVTQVDKATRKVTLAAPDGTETVLKAGPEVVNFDQIEVSDQVKATITEQLAVFVRKSTEAASTPETTTVALAPIGAKPGVVMANTVELTGKITAIDQQNHKATLQFPDGQSKTFPVRPDVDLSKQSVGDEVVLRSTESVAIRVEKQ